jgi:hypothetical protein
MFRFALENVSTADRSDVFPHSVSRVLKPVHPAANSKILSQVKFDRQFFDPAKKLHREAFYTFRKSGKWPMKFHNEYPFCDVVATITSKMLAYIEQHDLVQ